MGEVTLWQFETMKLSFINEKIDENKIVPSVLENNLCQCDSEYSVFKLDPNY